MGVSLEEFEKAVARLKEALARPKDEFIRDSVIQRFEFCVELAWKTSVKVLGLTSRAPKVVVREMAQSGVIEDPETWFKLLDARNLATHSYNEQVAEEVYALASASLTHFESLVGELKNK